MNKELLMWLVLVSWAVFSVANIIAGALKVDRSTEYGFMEVVGGLIGIGAVVWVLVD